MAKRKSTKGQSTKQRSTKHTHTTKDRVTRTPLKTGFTKTIIAYEISYVFYVLLNRNDERVCFDHGKPLVRAAIG
jgi:hypothetical protein